MCCYYSFVTLLTIQLILNGVQLHHHGGTSNGKTRQMDSAAPQPLPPPTIFSNDVSQLTDKKKVFFSFRLL